MTDDLTRPNYFELLELDPSRLWNDDEFQKRLTHKQAEWTRRVQHPKYATRYSRYLELVPQIKIVMSDPEQRQQEARQAVERQARQQQQKQQQLAEDIELLVAKGFITDEDIAALVQLYAGVTGDAEIRKAIQQRGVSIRASKPVAETTTLDAGTMKSIQAQLDLLGKSDLYSFLGYTPATTTADLLRAARALYESLQQKATKTSEVTAMSMLTGHAMRLFKDDGERRKYDEARAELAYQSVLEAPLIRLLQGPDKTLYAGQLLKLLEQARSHRLDVDKAAAYIRERARKLGAAVEVTDVTPVKMRRVCPHCDTIADPDAKSCPVCGTPLETPCPGCGKLMLTEHNVCKHCGFPLADIFAIHHQLMAAMDFLREQRYDLAGERLRHAWFLWNRLPACPHQNDLLVELEWQFQQAEDELQWQQEQLSTLRQHIDARRFYQARDLLRQLEADWGTTVAQNERVFIETTISNTEALLNRARLAGGDAAVERYLEILRICADCREAQDALARIPPAPPTALAVHQGNEIVSLEWQPSPSRDVHYVIQRKAHARPVSVNDGTRLATQTATRFDDTLPEVGLPVYYAVFAERGGVYSTDAALSSVPILLVRSVSTLTAGVDNGTVRLAWEPPPNAHSIWVVRAADHYPRTPTDGEPVRVLDMTYTADSGLINGQTYYYSVFSVFLDHKGQTIAGPAAYIAATPQEPPTFITQLEFEVVRKGMVHELLLSWLLPDKGEVAILRSQQPPPYVETQIIPATDLAQHGEVLITQSNRLKTAVEAARRVYFTPIVLFENMAYIGKTHDYASLEDVSNLRAQNLGTELQLRWDWPPNCRKVIVAYSHTEYPTTHEGIRIELTRAQYNLRGYYPIIDPAQRDYYIVVFAVIDEGGQELLASGRTARARLSLSGRVSVQYEIARQRKLFGSGPLALILHITGNGPLPELVLVQKQGMLPATKTDGTVIHRIAAASLATGNHTLPLATDGLGSPGFARLFLTDDTCYESKGGHVRIIHPAQEKMRLS